MGSRDAKNEKALAWAEEMRPSKLAAPDSCAASLPPVR
jgi:hypothetical protein